MHLHLEYYTAKIMMDKLNVHFSYCKGLFTRAKAGVKAKNIKEQPTMIKEKFRFGFRLV